ncbi:MAG: FAD binding domain-containing protein [Acidobacteriota bacterium]
MLGDPSFPAASQRFFQPSSIAEALALKGRLGKAASFLAGGTDLVVGVRKGRRQLDTLIDLSRVRGLDELEPSGDRLRIGAMCRLRRLESCSVDALAAACATVGGPQIRNLGTIGGQLDTASPAGDVSTALIALEAEVELASVDSGSRRLPLADFFLAPGKTDRADDEMIVAVEVPTNRRSSFYKIGKRNAVAISLVMAAASIGPAGDVALGLGCVAPKPLRPRRAEAHLRQAAVIDSTAMTEAARLVGEEVSPIDDHRGGAEYRRSMAVTLTHRLLSELIDITPGNA